MTQFLPPNLLALFAPRDPIQYLPPAEKLPHEKKLPSYNGVGHYISLFEDPIDTPPPTRVETREERQERKRREKQEQVAYKLEQDIALWDPHNAQDFTSDPFKTLFVARINYYSSEHKLRREFETYGPVKKIHIVQSTSSGKQKGYAFIEYEHERDMHSAYKHADGKKIDGRRVLVDVERSRTVKGWLPRRLGGGLGGTRRGGPDVNVKISGREDYREDRYDSRDGDRDRDRGRVDRDRRSRSRDKERRRRSRSRSHDRRRERKSRRSRSRDRDSRSDRDRGDRDRGDKGNRGDRGDKDQTNEVDRVVIKIEDEEKPSRSERERRRSRSRDRDRKRRRSRSRSKDRKRRDRDRSRRDDRDRPDKEKMVFDPDIQIKKEPVDDYPEFPPITKSEDTDDRKENIRRVVENVQNGNNFEEQE